MKILILGAGKMGSFFTDLLSFEHEVAVLESDPKRMRFIYNALRLQKPEEVAEFKPEFFNHSIEGEGYRMRQCFTPGGAVDYAAFDASFAQACVGESEDKLCRLALGRLVQPFGLGDDARADYELYLTAHPEAAFRRAIDDRDEAALRLLVGLSLPTADAAVYCARVGWSAGAAVLLGRAKRAKKTYDFDDL